MSKEKVDTLPVSIFQGHLETGSHVLTIPLRSPCLTWQLSRHKKPLVNVLGVEAGCARFTLGAKGNDPSNGHKGNG